MNMIKLGTPATDTATGLKGMVTQMQLQSDLSVWYVFQPRGLDPASGQPVKNFWVTANRVQGGCIVPAPHLPVAVLGTQVTDIASGFKGTAVDITLHISGCVHVTVQPKGLNKGGSEKIDACNFDIRQLKGKALAKLSEAEKELDRQAKPSPGRMPSLSPK